MNRSLRNRLRRVEREHGADRSVRYLISSEPHDPSTEPIAEKDETAPPMTPEEWEAKFCDESRH